MGKKTKFKNVERNTNHWVAFGENGEIIPWNKVTGSLTVPTSNNVINQEVQPIIVAEAINNLEATIISRRNAQQEIDYEDLGYDFDYELINPSDIIGFSGQILDI